MLGAKPDSLLDTVMPGWTACTWFYTPPGATEQAEFTVQAYTGEEILVKWRMDTNPANRLAGVTVNSLADYVQEGYTWVIPESKLRAVQALQDGRYVFLRFPSDNLALSTESQIADYLSLLFRRRRLSRTFDAPAVAPGLSTLIACSHSACGVSGQTQNAAAPLCEYCRRLSNAPGMRNDYFCAQSYPIGSGAFECAANTIVHGRLRWPGRGWQRQHVQALLAGLGELRASALRMPGRARH